MNTPEVVATAVSAGMVASVTAICLTARGLLHRGFSFTFTVAPEPGSRPWSAPQQARPSHAPSATTREKLSAHAQNRERVPGGQFAPASSAGGSP